LGRYNQKSGDRKSGPPIPGPEPIEIWLKNSPEENSRLREALNALAARHQLSPKVLQSVQLAAEEHFTNILSHAYEDREEHQIQFRVVLKENLLEAQILDDGKPFNPLDHPLPNTLLSLDEKPIGGLGILMIRKMMDEVSYVRLGNRNVLTLRKKIDDQ
jgi:serine/threonine-protein kinase RsbW